MSGWEHNDDGGDGWGLEPSSTDGWGLEPRSSDGWGLEPTSSDGWGLEPSSTDRWGSERRTSNGGTSGPSRSGKGLLPSPHPSNLPNPKNVRRNASSSGKFGEMYKGYEERYVGHAGRTRQNHQYNEDDLNTNYGRRELDKSGYGRGIGSRMTNNLSRPKSIVRHGTLDVVEGGFNQMTIVDKLPKSIDGAGNDPYPDYSSACSNGNANIDAYQNVSVEVNGKDVPRPLNSFKDIGSEVVIQINIEKCGYKQPTPIQKHAIPVCLSGRDLMATAQTGSGKTAAFCLPIIVDILRCCTNTGDSTSVSMAAPFAVILSPTRELTSQIHEEAKKFSHNTSVRVAVVYGGVPIGVQVNNLQRGVDILVATPGRLSDLMDRRKVTLSNVEFLVLDEADRMLDMGFEPQIRRIVEEGDMPPVKQRQTLLFSATFPNEIKRLARTYLSEDHVHLSVGRTGSSTNLIKQVVERHLEVTSKRNRLLEFFRKQEMRGGKERTMLTVVFVETKREVDSLTEWLCRMGCSATSIHGDRTQYERERSMKAFRSGKMPMLIATDVAARGLDVSDISLVVNYDLPREIDTYVHRIGRTGRAGRMGTAISFFSENDASLAKPLVDLLKEAKQEVPEWLLDFADSRHTRVGRRSSSKN
ncbi:hypothetical protein KP509_28G041400 [Ceratopteris richardii]|nr:hypothetical protein KP509_28G041400 [Ceratopteris richardii]